MSNINDKKKEAVKVTKKQIGSFTNFRGEKFTLTEKEDKLIIKGRDINNFNLLGEKMTAIFSMYELNALAFIALCYYSDNNEKKKEIVKSFKLLTALHDDIMSNIFKED